PPAVHLGPMRPQWLRAADGTPYLILVRSARLEAKTVFQGIVLDWRRLFEVLQDEVKPLFPGAKLEPVFADADASERTMTALPAQVRQTWADRCAADGKDLVVISTLPPGQEVCTDARVAAQILGNLIDNARKYSRDAADRRIWVWAKPGGRRRVVLEVEDRGP